MKEKRRFIDDNFIEEISEHQLLYWWRTNDPQIYLLKNKDKLRLFNLILEDRRNE